MSFIPKWITEFNYIRRFFVDPCDAPLTTYVETFFPAALEALITYYQPDVKQILITVVRPAAAMMRTKGRRKGGGGNKSGRGPKGSLIGRALSFDTSNEMGKRLPGAERLRGRKVSAGVVTLWIAEGLIERALFWVMVVDIIGTFFYRWASLLEKTIFCQSRGATLLVVTKPSQAGIGAVGWFGVTMSDILKQRGNVSWGIAAAGFTGADCVTVWTGTVHNLFNEPVSAGLRIVQTDSEGTRPVATQIVDLPPLGSAQLTVSAKSRGPVILRPEFRVFGLGAELRDMVFYLQGDIEE